MRAVFGLVLIIGLALAGGAVYLIQGYVSQNEALLQQEREFRATVGNLVQVYVYNKPMSYGEPLTPEAVQLIYWPEAALPPTIFRDPAVLFPENAKGPRYAMRPTEAFEPVLGSRVTEPGELAGLTAKLEDGMRAFQITVGVASGVAGFVQPDDFIDIYWTGGIRGVEGEVTRLIESSIQIIAVDNAFNEGQVTTGDARTVTVAATPEQVARLAQAQSTGRLSMSLVGEGGDVVEGTIEIDTDKMLGITRAEPAPVAAPAPVEQKCYLQQRKGGELVNTDVEIPCN